MLLYTSERLSAFGIPEDEASILRGRNQPIGVLRYSHGPNGRIMTLVGLRGFTRGEIPSLQSAVLRGGEHVPPVVREPAIHDRSFVPAQFVKLDAGFHIPKSQHAVGGARGEDLFIRGESAGVDLRRMAEGAELLSGVHIPQPHGA